MTMLGGFQRAPTLVGECYRTPGAVSVVRDSKFQWAPTLGGECYLWEVDHAFTSWFGFNGHPPLGVNATGEPLLLVCANYYGFNGHPPLGVNATCLAKSSLGRAWTSCFNGHPPLGVNATKMNIFFPQLSCALFQWAPTLGGECYRSCRVYRHSR